MEDVKLKDVIDTQLYFGTIVSDGLYKQDKALKRTNSKLFLVGAATGYVLFVLCKKVKQQEQDIEELKKEVQNLN